VTAVRSRARRVLRVGGAALVFILLAGATYQGVATALERRELRHPGGLVSIGDHQLHLYCTGTGTPTVILEAPAAGLSAAWGAVQQRLTRTTRTCSYDRSGLGWSEAGDRPFDPGRVPEELRTLLTSAREAGPFVVVGHGLGATFARLYAARADANATSIVLIDPPQDGGPARPDTTWLMPASPWLARVGVLRAGRVLSSKAKALPGFSGAATRAFLNRPDHLTRAAAEVSKWDEATRLAARTPPAANVREVVVEVEHDDRIEFLSDPAAVDRVVDAIVETITTSRGPSAAP
jgi:pimeloyl-ACP methyl ester carboxylesterase